MGTAADNPHRRPAVLAAAVSEETGIPLLCHTALETLAGELEDLPLFPIRIYMKKPWE